MTSYKIHSIKDSEKLSFIIEGEDEKALTQKLSSEGHIILSVKKIEIPLESLFCFEGKKSDGSFLEGKISADNIFIAYEMLKKEYKYTITKLYPETVIEKEKQEKIFRELLATFQEKNIKKEKVVTDTSKQALEKYKKILAKLVTILQKEKVKWVENMLPDLKKLDQNNNVTLIQWEIKNILKDISKKRENTVLFDQIRPLMKEMKIFVLPDVYFSLFVKIFHIFKSLDPLIHPREIQTQRHTSSEILSAEALKKEYETVQNNKHIHTFLRKKYREKVSNIFHEKTKKFYIYTLFREKRVILLGKKTMHDFQKVTTIALLFTVFITCTVSFFSLYDTIVVTTNILIIFIVLLLSSLVIQSETV
jgi:hypothetical protein